MTNLHLNITSLLITAFSVSIVLILAMLAFRSSHNRFKPAMDMVLSNTGTAILSLNLLLLVLFLKKMPLVTHLSLTVMVYFSYRAIYGVYGVRIKQVYDLIILGATILLNIIFIIIPQYSYQQIVYGILVGFFYFKALRIIILQTNSNRTKGDIFVAVYLSVYALMFIFRGGYFVFNHVHELNFISEPLSPIFIIFTIVLILFGNTGFLIVATVRADRERDRALENALEQKVFVEHLISIISHNLNSNLATINQVVDLMRKNNPTGAPVQELDIIERTTRQTGNILTDLVYWGQSRSGTAQKSNSYISVSALIWQVSNDLSQLILLKKIELNLTEKQGNIHLLADTMAARVVLRNILSKLLMFSPRKGLLTIEVNPGDTDVGITIQGRGKGISEAVGKALKPSENSGEEPGTGTGLLIVSTVCHSYGWPLTFQLDSPDIAGITVQFPRFKSQ